jgi:hypothetical protein
VCLRKPPTGRPTRNEVSSARFKEKIEDIEFLLDTGVRLAQLVERSAYIHDMSLRRALIRANRPDLLERVKRLS